MSSKHRRLRDLLGASGETILAALQTRAMARATVLGHLPGMWGDAKRKYGKAAKQAQCLSCGKKAIIVPYGNPNGPKIAQDNPVIMGDAVFERCAMQLDLKNVTPFGPQLQK